MGMVKGLLRRWRSAPPAPEEVAPHAPVEPEAPVPIETAVAVDAPPPVAPDPNPPEFRINERYTAKAPAQQNAIDLFAGYWTTQLPGLNSGGSFGGFDDHRIRWLLETMDVSGRSVLELGPLEGGHTFMLEQAGAKVTAIEGNQAAFLRCLAVKNAYDMQAQFLLGDFAASFGPPAHYDLVVASGVLYHMTEPVQLLRRIADTSDRMFLWTHYFDPDVSRWNPAIQALVGTSKWRVDLTETVIENGVTVRMVPQFYMDALGFAGFCGGPQITSKWIYREDLLLLIKALGFADVRVAFESPDHPNGPSFCLYAARG